MKKSFLLIFILLSSYISLLGQAEILVNNFQYNDQTAPIITTIDRQNNIAIVWVSTNQVDSSSESDIFLRKYDKDLTPLSEELIVNDITSGLQEEVQIASNKNGKFVIVWTSFERIETENFFDIKARVFDQNGAISQEFLVNSYQPHTQTRPQIDMNKNGDFIIVWESWYQDGSDRGVYAQYFNNDGSKNGSEFRVNTSISYSKCKPVVSFFDDNKFIIVWEAWDESEKGYDIIAKIYDENSNLIKDEFLVNSFTDNYQWYSDVTTYSDNSFDIVWCSWEQDGSDGGIYLRSFKEDYKPVSEEILVNSSTKYYQWLPKLSKLNNNIKAVIWSSWNIDGSREGVYYKLLDNQNREISLETRFNDYTNSYQWQPDLIYISEDELIGVWASWGQYDNNYDIIAKKISPSYLYGSIDATTLIHSSGKSSSNFIVHVIDSSKMNGHNYEITFSNFENNYLSFSVTDITANELKVSNIPLNFGNDVKYLSDQFDGIVVEVIPNFNLTFDLDKSKIVNNSKSTINFSIVKSSIFPAIAPVDLALVWGNTDTLSNGSYASIIDTALSPSNIKEILIPFEVVDLSNGKKSEVLVFENNTTQNKQWDFGEDIYILTPEEYKTSDFNTHVQILSSTNSGEIILPNLTDTIYIITKKPITIDDTYQFSTNLSNVIVDIGDEMILNEFQLFQNFPNPFNPTTTIKYTIPSFDLLNSFKHLKNSENPKQAIPAGRQVRDDKVRNVELKVYDILGREVTTLVNEIQKPGNYQVKFDAGKLTSGVYFYTIKYENFYKTKKMMVVK